MNLIAEWKKPKNEYFDPPTSVRWAGGAPATLQDYERHRLDTRKLINKEGWGQQLHIWPGIVAQVYWCPWGRTWGIRGDGVESEALNLRTENATDDQIAAAMSVLAITYRYKVNR